MIVPNKRAGPMLRQLLVGGFVSVCNIAIHALVMSLLIHVVQRIAKRQGERPPQLFLIATMIGAISTLMAAHACEVGVWAVAYHVVGAAPPGINRVYFAFVNYTTLGYGDVVPVARWQLLGPLTAMNGVLLFGWSTAVIFDVLQRTRRHFDAANP